MKEKSDHANYKTQTIIFSEEQFNKTVAPECREDLGVGVHFKNKSIYVTCRFL